jgi:DNA polymerase-3 subunit delta'
MPLRSRILGKVFPFRPGLEEHNVGWQHIRGHEHIKEGFQHAFRRNRLAHAYLFTGPVGVGKHFFGVELAKALLCEGRKETEELDACDRCHACVQVEAGTHPDFFPAARPAESLEFPIALMRTLCQSFSLKPARGRGKVVLLDDADDLNEESANCFLKTLEEPPPRSVLVLIGTSPDRQLATIVSRCQVIPFRPLPATVVNDLLRAQGVEDARLRDNLVRLSLGSPGLARTLADPALWAFRSQLLEALCRLPFDSLSLGKQWMEVVEGAGKESAAQRHRSGLILRLLIDSLSDALSLSQGGEAYRSGPAEQARLRALANQAGTQRLLECLERCLEADVQSDRRVPLALLVEGMLDALAGILGR